MNDSINTEWLAQAAETLKDLLARKKRAEAGAHLKDMKARLGHGAFLPWLKRTGASPRTAQKLMANANADANANVTTDQENDTVNIAQFAEQAHAIRTFLEAGDHDKAGALLTELRAKLNRGSFRALLKQHDINIRAAKKVMGSNANAGDPDPNANADANANRRRRSQEGHESAQARHRRRRNARARESLFETLRQALARGEGPSIPRSEYAKLTREERIELAQWL
jgi:hypothetical protein